MDYFGVFILFILYSGSYGLQTEESLKKSLSHWPHFSYNASSYVAGSDPLVLAGAGRAALPPLDMP